MCPPNAGCIQRTHFIFSFSVPSGNGRLKAHHVAGRRAGILIGGGVKAAVIRDFRRLLPEAEAFHLSGKTAVESGMVYRNERVHMGIAGISEFQLWRTSEEAIRRAAEALKEA